MEREAVAFTLWAPRPRRPRSARPTATARCAQAVDRFPARLGMLISMNPIDPEVEARRKRAEGRAGRARDQAAPMPRHLRGRRGVARAGLRLRPSALAADRDPRREPPRHRDGLGRAVRAAGAGVRRRDAGAVPLQRRSPRTGVLMAKRYPERLRRHLLRAARGDRDRPRHDRPVEDPLRHRRAALLRRRPCGAGRGRPAEAQLPRLRTRRRGALRLDGRPRHGDGRQRPPPLQAAGPREPAWRS